MMTVDEIQSWADVLRLYAEAVRAKEVAEWRYAELVETVSKRTDQAAKTDEARHG
jgi:hypothetical protein